MEAKRFSVVVPTILRDSLRGTLESIAGQELHPRDEILVCHDSFATPPGREQHGKAFVSSFGPQFKYLCVNAGRKSWGHDQVNFAMKFIASGDWLLLIDDDDVFAPGAFARIREEIGALVKRTPMIFRWVSPTGTIYWHKKIIRHGKISGQCLVAPVNEKLSYFDQKYDGDFRFIADTLANHNDEKKFMLPVITLSRFPLWWRAARSEDDIEFLRVARNSGREWMTRSTEIITPEQQVKWWNSLDRSKWRINIFYNEKRPIGYGSLRLEDDKWWSTTVVLPEFRGKGFGSQIDQMMLFSAPGDVYGEILRDNRPAFRAARAAGYETKETNENGDALVWFKRL